MQKEPHVPLSKISAFVRKLTHDLRNHLNSSGLEVTYLADCAEDSETLESLKKIQEELHHIENHLRSVSRKLAAPHPVQDLTEVKLLQILWQEAQASVQPSPQITYAKTLPEAFVKLDVDDFIAIAAEILKNTVQHGSAQGELSFEIDAETETLAVRFTEMAVLDVHPHQWGESPFVSNQMKSHGLGLFMAGRLVQANGGEIRFHFNESQSVLCTELRFPLQTPFLSL